MINFDLVSGSGKYKIIEYDENKCIIKFDGN